MHHLIDARRQAIRGVASQHQVEGLRWWPPTANPTWLDFVVDDVPDSLPASRSDLESALRMIEVCRRRDIHIPCHERMTVVEEDDADEDGVRTINPQDPICRGFYDACPRVGQLRRIMERLSAMEEVL